MNLAPKTMKARKSYAQESDKIYTQAIAKEALSTPEPISSTVEPTSTATMMSTVRPSTPYSKYY